MKEPLEETNEQYLDRIFQQEPYMAQCAGFREFLLESMDEIGARPRASECASMLRAFNAGCDFKGSFIDMARTGWAVATGMENPAAMPFTYTDDICQIGEHDVHLGGVELTKDIGEFKVGEKFSGATIDFQGGHLTLETAAGQEHRYSFVMKVGAKHEGYGDVKTTGESCFCGAPFPWHLHKHFDERMTHTCHNGHVWKWVKAGFSYAGLGVNPFAEYDRAAAARRK